MIVVLSSLLIGLVTAQDKPNILFLFVDDLGWNDVGFHGASDAYTPFIDNLAEQESLILENMYAQHYCTQSRSSLLTGRYPIRMGLQHRVIEPAAPYSLPFEIPYPNVDSEETVQIRTLPEILKENGYQTHLVGKWHLGFAEPQMLPEQRGFDSFFGFFNGEGDHWFHFKTYKDMFGYDLRDGTEAIYRVGDYSSYVFGNVTRDLIKDIAATDNSDPFFIELAFQVVHSPNQAPNEYKEPYLDLRNVRRIDRIAMSTAVDAVVEELVTLLKDEDLWDDTLVIFQSDNGGATTHLANNYPLRGGKLSLYEGGLKTVAFVTGGALEEDRKGQTSDRLMHISDWMPTFMEMAGITDESEYLATLDGVSQMACIQEDAAAVRTDMLHNVDPLACNTEDNLCGAIRVGDWKLAVGREVTAPLNILAGWVPLIGPSEHNPTIDCNGQQPDFEWDPQIPPFNDEPVLYNIANDPCEYNDVSADNADKVAELLALLTAFNETMMPPAQLVYPEDIDGSDPANLDGFWGPWLEDGTTYAASAEVDTSAPTSTPTSSPTSTSSPTPANEDGDGENDSSAPLMNTLTSLLVTLFLGMVCFV